METLNSLIKLEEATRYLAELKSVDEVKSIRDKAEAMRVYAKQARLGLESQNYAAEIKLRAERRAGELLRELEISKNSLANLNTEKSSPSISRTKLADLEITPNQSSSWQRIASLPEERFEEHIAEKKAAGEELTTSGVLHIANGSQSRRVLHSSESNEWYTPRSYIEAVRELLGAIDLDPASSEAANVTVRAENILTIEDDGLSLAWFGRVFLNPPYGRDNGQENWSRKLIEEFAAGHVTEAVLLVNAVTDTKWFQRLWNYPICFTDHRISFSKPGGDEDRPTHGNAFVYLGTNTAEFIRLFSPFGAIVQRIG